MRWMRFIFPLLLLLAMANPAQAQAKVFTFSGLNCSCAVPNSWSFRSTQGSLIDAFDSGHQKFFAFKILPLSNHYLQEAEPLNVEKLFVEEGYNSLSHTMVMIQGAPFLRVDGVRDLGNKNLFVTKYLGEADGYIYILNLYKYNGSPNDDDEMQGIFTSFHFLRTPALTHDDYKLIYAAEGLGVLGVLLILLILIGWGLYALVRGLTRRSPRDRNLPPPPVFQGLG